MAGLTATCFIGPAVAITIDAIAAPFRRSADQRTSETPRHGADSCSAPTVGNGSANNCAGAGSDGCSLLCGCAGCECANCCTDEYDFSDHLKVPPVWVAIGAAKLHAFAELRWRRTL